MQMKAISNFANAAQYSADRWEREQKSWGENL